MGWATLARTLAFNPDAARKPPKQAARFPLSVLAACSLACAGVGATQGNMQLFTDQNQFWPATGAALQPPILNLRLVGHHVASARVGDLAFSINNESPELARSLSGGTPLHEGIELGLSHWAALNVTSAFSLYSRGSFPLGRTDQLTSCKCTHTVPTVTRARIHHFILGLGFPSDLLCPLRLSDGRADSCLKGNFGALGVLCAQICGGEFRPVRGLFSFDWSRPVRSKSAISLCNSRCPALNPRF